MRVMFNFDNKPDLFVLLFVRENSLWYMKN